DEQRHPADAEKDVLPDDATRALAEVDDVVDLLDVVTHQHDVGCLDCDVGADCAHCNADRGGRHCRCVVDAVANHGDAPRALPEHAYGLDLLVRQQPGTHLVGPDGCGNGPHRVRMVTGQHGDPSDSLVLEVPDGRGGVRLQLVAERHCALRGVADTD